MYRSGLKIIWEQKGKASRVNDRNIKPAGMECLHIYKYIYTYKYAKMIIEFVLWGFKNKICL